MCVAPASFESFITFPIGIFLKIVKKHHCDYLQCVSFLNHLFTVTGNNDII